MAPHFIEELLLEAERRTEQERIEVDRLRADQMLAGIAEIERQMADVIALVTAEAQLLEQYRISELSRLEKKLSWLTFNLDGFMRSTGEKTLRLPHGLLRLRKGRDRIVVSDMKAFLAIAGQRGLLKQVPELFLPDMKAVADYHKRTGGALPDGCELVKGDTKFSYSTNGEDDGTETDGNETEDRSTARPDNGADAQS